ncbi:MAG: hypothetical protein COA57_04220 [Flavobacteriales bacterium]|nr:MAG: hypothetical protein COA57_04220 [Flavobacteriales bacterium]
MKKLKLTLIAATIFGGSLFAQPVSDVAVIPVAVTINTVLRLNVVAGGNIEFVINTIGQYYSGIENNLQHDTRFTVATSRNFVVQMGAEDVSLVGTDRGTALGANSIPLNNIGYSMTATGNHGDPSEIALLVSGAAVTPLIGSFAAAAGSHLIVSNLSSSAGGTDDNAFTINWVCATPTLTLVTTQTTLLQQNIAQDRYITNVYLVVAPI